MPFVFLQLLYTGHLGRDVAEGFGGNDVFDLFDGNDRVFLSGGSDEINAGDGTRDSVSGAYLENGIRVNLAKGQINEKNTTNVTLVTGVEDVVGTAQADEIFGNSGSNRLNGGSGDDILDGRGGSDILTGGSGRDILKGGFGNDILKGGPGRDRFVFDLNGGTDKIKDFEDNLDRLDLQRLGFSTLEEAEAAAVEQNGDVVITGSGTTIIVENITKAALFDGDVIF
jgi:Ca2+-binding RTX toxin-like protein